MSETLRATVVGAGAWGTALAKVLVDKGHDVTLWSYEAEVASAINGTRENPYLPGVALPVGLRAETNLAGAVEGADLVVSVSPSQVVRSVMEVAGPHMARGKSVDKKTDVWAFGCCLFEALTGKAPFVGETVSDTIVKILEREPAWEMLPKDAPPALKALLKR